MEELVEKYHLYLWERVQHWQAVIPRDLPTLRESLKHLRRFEDIFKLPSAEKGFVHKVNAELRTSIVTRSDEEDKVGMFLKLLEHANQEGLAGYTMKQFELVDTPDGPKKYEIRCLKTQEPNRR